jgi:hypothetical protein
MKKLIALCWIALCLAALPAVADDGGASFDPDGMRHNVELDLP